MPLVFIILVDSRQSGPNKAEAMLLTRIAQEIITTEVLVRHILCFNGWIFLLSETKDDEIHTLLNKI